jgi:hypothetical protein
VQNQALALFVVISSGIFFTFSLHAILSQSKKRAPETATALQPSPSPMGRSNASTGEPSRPQETHSRFGTQRVEQIKIGCIDANTRNEEIDSSADMVRLSGRICAPGRANMVSKVEASLTEKNMFLVGFYQDHSAIFSTDFFSLEPGVNTIHLRVSLKNGEKRETQLRLVKK